MERLQNIETNVALVAYTISIGKLPTTPSADKKNAGLHLA
jgi:hypothetical protein